MDGASPQAPVRFRPLRTPRPQPRQRSHSPPRAGRPNRRPGKRPAQGTPGAGVPRPGRAHPVFRVRPGNRHHRTDRAFPAGNGQRLPLRGAAEAIHLRRRPLLRGPGFLQPPAALLCADRSETRQDRPSGPGADADVRELLRPLRENRRGEFDHRYRALQAEEQGAGGNHPPQGRQHPRPRVSTLPAQQRRVAAKAHGVDRGAGMKAGGKRRTLGQLCRLISGQHSFWHPDGTPMSAQQFLEMLFGKLPEFFKDEDELRALWSDPGTRARLLEGLAEKGFGREQMAEMQKIIDAENSDLFDVLAHVAYALPPLTREERAARAKLAIGTHFNAKQQVFLGFVLSQYVKVGVEELDREKLSPLLKLKYNNAIADAWADLGRPEEVGLIFAGFQKYLYQQGA